MWYDKMCLVHFLHYPPSAWNQAFLQEPLVPHSGKWYLKKHNLGTKEY